MENYGSYGDGASGSEIYRESIGEVRQEEPVDLLSKFLDGQTAAIRGVKAGFVALGWSVDEVKIFLDAARRAQSPLTRDLAEQELNSELERAKRDLGMDLDVKALRQAGRHVTTLHTRLTDDQKQFVRREFLGKTDIEFVHDSNAYRVKHSVANAMRTVMAIQVFRLVPAGATVLEVGACPVSAVRRGVVPGAYLGCMPRLDIRDVGRINSKFRAISVLARQTGRRALKPAQAAAAAVMMQTPERLIVHKKVQDVDFQAEVIVSVDSNWDIPLRQVPSIMHRCGTRVWLMTYTRITGLQRYAGKFSGKVDPLAVTWRADCAKDEFVFDFDGDSSFSYIHSLTNARDYQPDGERTFRYADRFYVFRELPQSTTTQRMMAFVDASVAITRVPTDYCLRWVRRDGMVRVRCVAVDLTSRVGALDFKQYTHFDIHQDVLSTVLQDRLLMGAKGNVDTVVQYARANRVSVLHNGVRVSCEHPITVDLFRQFAVAVDSLARDMMRASDSSVDGQVKRLASGGLEAYGLASAAYDAVSQWAFGPGSFYEAVRARVKALVLQNEDSVVMVDKLPELAMEKYPVENLGGDRDRPKFSSGCFCEEKASVALMLRGGAGPLSDSEVKALQKYSSVLAEKECVKCITPDELLNRAEEESDEFFECNVGVKEFSDSGLGSSVDSDSDSEEFSAASDGLCDQGIAGGGSLPQKAIAEYCDILRRQMEAADSTTRAFVKTVMTGGKLTSQVLSTYDTEEVQHRLLTVAPGGRVLGVSNGSAPSDYQRAYDYRADVFVDLVRVPGTSFMKAPDDSSTELYTSTRYCIWNQPAILRTVQQLAESGALDIQEVRIPHVNGVFGCGKTHGAKKAFRESGGNHRLFLTASAESARAIRADLFGDSPVGLDSVRTYDSLLRNGMRGVYTELVLDEMCMAHFGQIIIALAMVKPKTVRSYGDFEQMEYKPFLGTFKALYSSARAFCDIVELNRTHRCRLSVVAAALPQYGLNSGLSICDCCDHMDDEEGGIDVIQISGIAEVPMGKNIKYLTPDQKSKFLLREKLVESGTLDKLAADDAVSTVVEYQGGTSDEVYVVRLDGRPKKGGICHEVQRANVGLTRSKLGCRYYTTSVELDAFKIKAANSKSEMYRGIIRENSARVNAEIRSVGVENYYRGFFSMESYVLK